MVKTIKMDSKWANLNDTDTFVWPYFNASPFLIICLLRLDFPLILLGQKMVLWLGPLRFNTAREIIYVSRVASILKVQPAGK